MRIEQKGNTTNKGTNNGMHIDDSKSRQSLEDKLLVWIDQSYPAVSDEKSCITTDVLKKLNKKIKNEN